MSDPVCSASQYSSSDQSTSARFSSSPSSGGTLTCEGPPPPPVPCDIEDLILNEIALTRQSEYRLTNGQFVAQAIVPGTRVISLRGIDHAAPRHDRLEVVGDRAGAAAVTRIRVRVFPFAAHNPDHVLVTVTRPSEADLVRHFPNQGTFDFEVYRTEADSIAGTIFERFFTLHLSPARYRITAESCGVRNTGVPVGGGALEVLVYPQDQYTLSLSVPALGSYSHTRTVAPGSTTETTARRGTDGAGAYNSTQTTTTAGDTVTTNREHTSSGSIVSHESQTVTNEDGSTVTISSADSRDATPTDPTFVFKKNGVEDLSVNITRLIHTLSSVSNAVAAIRNLVRQWVPQVGFRFEVSVEFFSGSISMSWGWKEYTDYRAYFSWVASVSMWLFKVGLSLSFGISVGPATLRVLGEMADAGVQITTSWEFNRPDNMVLPPTARARGTLPLEVRGEAVVDIYVARASAAAGVRSGFTVEGGTRLTASSEVQFYASIVWSGLDAFVQTQRPGAGVEEEVYHLIDHSNIWSGQVPI